MGHQSIIDVDDRFPVDDQKQSVFWKIKSDNNITEFWPVLLEKAYAKLHGCYESINGGRPEQGLVDITNGISELINFDSEEFEQMKNNGSFWDLLQNCINSGYLLAASSNGESDTVETELGIVEGHAYAVLDAQELNGVQLINLRNPWGDSEWKGEWSDFDIKHWTESNKGRIEAKQKAKGRNPFKIGEDDGAFWMSIPDFLANYANLSIVRIYETPKWFKWRVTGKWKGISAGGCPNFSDTFKDNPQFKMTVRESTQAVIYMQQYDRRGKDSEQTYAVGFGIYSLNGKKLATNRVPKATYKWDAYNFKRDFYVEYDEIKKSDTPYTVICATFEPGKESEFTMTIFSKKHILIEPFY